MFRFEGCCSYFYKVLNSLMGDLKKRGMRGLLYIDDKLTVGLDGQNCLFGLTK